MSKSLWLRNVVLAILPLLIFGFIYRIRADQKRTLFSQSNVIALAFVADTNQLAASTGTMGDFQIWNVPSRKLISKGGRNSSDRVEDQFFGKGLFLAHFGSGSQMEIRDMRTGKVVQTIDCKKEIEAQYQNYEDLGAGYLSNDGKILALVTWTPPNDRDVPSNGKLRLWNLQKHRPICVIQASALPPNFKPGDYYIAPAISSVRFAPDDKSMAIGLNNGEVSLWSVPAGQLKHRLSGQQNAVKSLAFAPDGTRLASGSIGGIFDKSVRNSINVWNTRQGALLYRLNVGAGATALTFSPDGKWVASGDEWGGAALWNISTGKLRERLNGHSQWISGLDFSSDGKTLATGSWDKKIKLWRIE